MPAPCPERTEPVPIHPAVADRLGLLDGMLHALLDLPATIPPVDRALDLLAGLLTGQPAASGAG